MPGAATTPRFSVIVPALNEEANLDAALAEVVRGFDAAGLSMEVLVFDDASTDRTGAIADAWAARDPRLHAFHNPRRLNIGGIYKAGIREARGEYTLLVPGDNEMLVDEILKGARLAHTADVVLFYVTNASQVRAGARNFVSGFYVRVVNLLFNTRFRQWHQHLSDGAAATDRDHDRGVLLSDGGRGQGVAFRGRLHRRGDSHQAPGWRPVQGGLLPERPARGLGAGPALVGSHGPRARALPPPRAPARHPLTAAAC